jgi:membrane protease YdiL (CAAX protease family)
VKNSISTKLILPITLVVVYTIAILFLGKYSGELNLSIGDNAYLNSQINYQPLLLVITTISILSTFLLNRESFKHYFSWGSISALAKEMKFFGIKEGDSWLKTGLSLCVVITGITAVFMYFQIQATQTDFTFITGALTWILLFSLTNSFGEEMIFRMGIVAPLKDIIPPKSIYLISAILFGIPHFAGMPSGIIGATMAGVLGYVLAKSMVETKGIFWAWTIHFLQDVVIIGSLFLMNY